MIMVRQGDDDGVVKAGQDQKTDQSLEVASSQEEAHQMQGRPTDRHQVRLLLARQDKIMMLIKRLNRKDSM